MLGLRFEGGKYPFLRTSVHFTSKIDNIILKVQYFWTLHKKLNKTVV
jgi:hypothetical protein